MTDTATLTDHRSLPLTDLSEDERMFQDQVRAFAEEKVRPLVSKMDAEAKLDPALKNDIETVLRETKRCAGIVKGLLEFARCAPPQKSPCSLNDISDAALELVRHQILFQDVTIARNYSGRIPQLLLDPNQIEQVLVNMLVNAGHAMRGEGMVMVVTGIDPSQGMAFLEISDNGCGIPEANLDRIFDPFFTTKSNKGTGLGLSVSYGIIQEHGGHIEVQSQEGAGTTFTILFPIPEADATAPSPAAPAPHELPAEPAST